MAATKSPRFPIRSVPRAIPQIHVIPDLGAALSMRRLDDYLRLLGWILYAPQSLKAYQERCVRREQGMNWGTVERMAAVLVFGIAVVTSYLGVLALFLMGDGAVLRTQVHVYWMAWFLSLLGTSMVLVVLYMFRLEETPAVLVAPVLSGLSVFLAFAYLRGLQLSFVRAQDVVTLYGVLGAFGGLMYSQVCAYRNFGQPYRRYVIASGVVFALPAFALAVIANLILPRWEPLPQIGLDLLVVVTASFGGFMLLALRLDDWLMAWLHTLMRFGSVVYPPRVSPLPFMPLFSALQDTADDDWPVTVENAANAWRYTWQHRVITKVLYDSLSAAPEDERSTRLAVVTNGRRPWERPVWFVYGGRRTTLQLIDSMKGYSLQRELPPGNAPLGLVNKHFVTMQICTEADNLEDACSRMPQQVEDEEDANILDLLSALRELLGELNVMVGYLDLRDTRLLPKGALSAARQGQPAWVILQSLVRIYHYAWLVHRSQANRHRVEGAQAFRNMLRLQREAVMAGVEIPASIREFLLEVINKWDDDMQQMAQRPNQFERVEYPFPPDPDAVAGRDLPPAHLDPSEQVMRRRRNPFEYDEPIHDRTLLRGRSASLQTLKECWGGPHIQVVEVTAPILCGSSSLFLTTSDKCKDDKGIAILFAYVCVGHLNTDAQATERLANGLYDEMLTHSEVKPSREALLLEPRRTLELMIRDICVRQERKLVVGLDDLDYMERVISTRSELRRFLQFIFHLNEVIPRFGVVLIGTIDRADQYRRLRSYTTRFARPIELDTFQIGSNRTTLDRLLNAPDQGFEPRFTPQAVQRIIEYSGGVPYLVQLIAWNVYERFKDEYRFDTNAILSSNMAYVPDPLFTTYAVDSVLRWNTFRRGWKYYVHRMQEHFGTDWDDVEQVLDAISGTQPRLSAVQIAQIVQGASVRLDGRRVRNLLARLETQRVVHDTGKGLYTLRVGLMSVRRRTQHRIEDDDLV